MIAGHFNLVIAGLSQRQIQVSSGFFSLRSLWLVAVYLILFNVLVYLTVTVLINSMSVDVPELARLYFHLSALSYVLWLWEEAGAPGESHADSATVRISVPATQ